MVDCSIIIVNWNVRDYLRRCLASIPKQHGGYTIETIVVDNASTDGSLDMLRHEFPWVTVEPLRSNRGFARANNAALSKAQGRYVFILNPDTEIQGKAIETMIRYMDNHLKCALVAPQIVNPDGSFQEGSVRRDPTFVSQVIILLKLQHAVAKQPMLQRYYATDFKPEHEQQIEQPMGAALFIRKSVLDRVGHFDEGFFLWFEEVDLCKRLRNAGEQIWYLPVVTIMHHGGKSFEQALPLAKQRLYNKSALHYFSKHYGVPGYLLVVATIPINLLLVSIFQFFKKYAK
jgi:N-acetylglucosaminyl-diphospho-decaprenol L-rhamnosyltransferase